MNHQSRFNSNLWLLVLVAFNGVWLGEAQVPFPGKCPDVKVMDTFDLEAYMGVWYEYSKYPFAFEIGKKCIYANYGIVDNSTVSVVNAAINRFTGSPSNVTGTAKVIAPAQLAVAFYPNQQLTRANYLVLGTDYESYSVVYSCSSVTTLANFKVVWILTRQRQPSTETIEAAKKILDDNSISQAFLIDTIQTKCPQLDGNSTELIGDDTDVEDFVTTVVPNAIEKA
ncbi:apolipoprotein D [Drosophila bipectinata]|uniref:apolipoprotein D n=1 Tax=Drosophila bipectinata TaxID=42026 RepID=UPI0007E7A964|nr:apolipoprotein D [Drosophila bipectinata]